MTKTNNVAKMTPSETFQVGESSTTYAALLQSWMALEHLRESNRLFLNRLVLLKQTGENVNMDGALQQYILAEKELRLVEDQLRILLSEIQEEGEVEKFLESQHWLPTVGIVVKTPELLKRLLRSSLEAYRPTG